MPSLAAAVLVLGYVSSSKNILFVYGKSKKLTDPLSAAVFAQTPGFDPMSQPTNWQDVPAGEIFQITWDPTNYKGTVTLELLGGGSPATLQILGNIAQGVDNQKGQYNWPVPIRSDQLDTYGIRILLEANPSIFQYSFPFHIRPYTSQTTNQATISSASQVVSQTTPTTTSLSVTQSAIQSSTQPVAQTTTKLPDRCKVRRRWAPPEFGYPTS
ncbi:extracellular serine-threonine rich protein [Seiridium cupressi]